MQNAPARQPRVSPAAPRRRRTWVTPACLVGAMLIAGAVMLPPFAARTLFPSRSFASSSVASPGLAPVAAEPGTPSAALVQTDDKPDRNIVEKYSDLPLTAEPAAEPQGGAAPGAQPASGTLASGVFAARPELIAAEAPTELALQPIPPIEAAPRPSAEMRPAISAPPARRESLPLQTDLLPMETPGPPSATKPGPDRHG